MEEHEIIEAFFEIGDLQRDRPERAMLRATMFHHGVLSYLLEHVGDLTHRMTQYMQGSDMSLIRMNEGTVQEKTERALRYLDRDREVLGHRFMSFADEHDWNIRNNVEDYAQEGDDKYGIRHDEEKYREQLNKYLEEYAFEHSQLPAYNWLHFWARRAAISLGEQEWDQARYALLEIKNILDKGLYEEYAHAYHLDEDGNLMQIDLDGEFF
jgi:hypothetical protein